MCRNAKDLEKAREHLVTVLQYNGYPMWAINKGPNRSDRKVAQSSDENSNGSGQNSVKNKSFTVMDYIKVCLYRSFFLIIHV